MHKPCCIICINKQQHLGKFGKPPEDIICYIQALLMLTMASLAKKPWHNCQANSQKSHKRQVLVKDCKNHKNSKTIGNNGSVTEATETMKPLQLTNRFQPLLQIPTDDVCFSQPTLTDQSKSILVGKKTKMGLWKGVLRTLATSSLHKSSLLAMGFQKMLKQKSVPLTQQL